MVGRIEMTGIADLREMIEQDLPVDTKDLERSAVKNMDLYAKYMSLHSHFKLELRKALNHFNTVKTDKYRYYSGKDHKKVFEFTLAPAEIKQFLSGDRELQKAESELEITRIKVELVEDALKAIRDRGFTIKNIIELRRMEAGY